MTDTKQITFEGRTYEVPVWVKYVARDSDNIIYGYSEEPIFGSHNLNRNTASTKCFLLEYNYPWHWRDSLTKV